MLLLVSDHAPPSPEQRFAENLRAMREALGWNQSELARRLGEAGLDGFHQTTISRVEKGERPIRLGEATVVAQVLGVPVERLTGDGADLAALAGIRTNLARVRSAERDLYRALAAFDDSVQRLRGAVGDPDPMADGWTHSPWRALGEGPETLNDEGYEGEAIGTSTRLGRSMLTQEERAALHRYLDATASDVTREYENPPF